MNTSPDHIFDLATSLDAEGGARISITGDLDWDTAEELTAAARLCLGAEPPPRRLHLDCARMTLCDSLGLASLLMIHRAASGSATRLHLENRPTALQRLLEMTGTADLFTDRADESGQGGATRPPLPPRQP
ncbi:putative anti-sigma factor antagonist [Streptomyces zinciresistens K42]|uniref:Putative anti-sigma factor antagonist n=1 Tax=Streptomyces zinciresistens K42 TaxID=700597 RepID=G2GJ84_9ACTN|nr:STAS domain-containing protein [Streptomyces zinciresistens]EGX56435.1 putative anti-sigma factor antagonist [Streptomyces zinciresistens K42]